MKRQHCVLLLVAILGITSCAKMSDFRPNPTGDGTTADAARSAALTRSAAALAALPTPPNFKVAYYAFDATPTGSPVVNLPLTNFANNANVVVLFEGSAYELADSVHYGSSSSYILTVNPHYHHYADILRDVHTLQARGVKVLMNVDDASSWNTTTPFTMWNGTGLTYKQFAAYLKACIIDSLHFDGIALDVEHLGGTAANTNYTNLIKAFGSYFGPLSSNSTTTVYTAAIYDGAQAGFAIGQHSSVAKYLNFVEDMGYFEDDYSRFNNWAPHIGDSKTTDGMSKQYNSLSDATTFAAWEPSGGTKAGIMVFAGNVDSAYTNTIFRAVR
ncbi:EndoS/ChiA family endoglycosidase [Puia dinghuensis]|uniref:mannosyl-glycoprotein endo-beta-N-acetylglucosaminidase n=1 Tax=Puia dinghuensis TaxID=1792502 RepID=A0A8J2UE71_9BACT|nr:glycosyl hydrolase family 18 protein [Puia dinghuensis]GGB03574.1 hypothetical protein GCM10011511_28590 [Puia dinghuensis]